MRLQACLALSAFLSSAAVGQSAPASTQMPSAADVASRDTVTVGAGIADIPGYEGSNDYRLIPAAAIRGKIGGYSFTTRSTYFYFDAIRHGTAKKVELNFGPAAGIRLDRTGHIIDPIVKLLPRRHTAYEVGGFAGVSFHGLVDPYDTLAFRVDVLHDIGNAHKSTTFSPSLEFSTPLSMRTYASASIGTDFVSDRFANYYFSISPQDSLRSGLPPFNARGGMKDWNAGLLLNQSITGNLLGGLSVFVDGQYSRLVGDFKRSPIVSQRGTPNQWLGAVGLAYTW